MVKKIKQATDKSQAVKAKFIHIRNMPLEDRKMLFKLKSIFQYNQNPKNLVRAAYAFLEMRTKHEVLEKEVAGLREQISLQDEQREQIINEFKEVFRLEEEREDIQKKIGERKKVLMKKYPDDKTRKGVYQVLED